MAHQVRVNTKPTLSPADRDKLVHHASCAMYLVFQDGGKFTKWSNEYGQPRKLLNINDSMNEMFRIFDQYFRGSTLKGAIFDTREVKEMAGHNRIWQFENGSWKQVQQIYW